jgi:hypothetical protein
VVCFQLGEFESAKKALLEYKSQFTASDEASLMKEADKWIRKCDLEISGGGLEL